MTESLDARTTRERIMDAALTIFSRKGYHETALTRS
jgi:AcrR family transcriptional regulator